MSLSSNQLDAFLTISQMGSFSKASDSLHITQSALSQKIKLLEEELELTLFIRTPSGINLTEQGEKLLRYCQVRNSLESELLNDLSLTNDKDHFGVLRIASYSSIYRSVVIPVLTPFLRKNPNVRVEYMSCKMSELPSKLQRAEVDFIIMDYEFEKSNLKTHVLGKEKYVVIESKTKSNTNTFLDNDTDDHATESYFKSQNLKPPKYTRSYFDDCYGIIDGVASGLGRAVMPEHLVKNNKKIKISKKYKPVYLDVVLHYYQRPFYTNLHKSVVKKLELHCNKYLN